MLFILSMLSVAALLAAILLAGPMRAKLQASAWPQHPATITHSVLTRKIARLGPQFYVQVKFTYSADGPRSGACVLPSHWGTSRENYARRLASHFRQGATVMVHVDSRHPARAELLPGLDGREWAMLFLMIFVAVGAGAGAFFI
jgi:hypothetical protein